MPLLEIALVFLLTCLNGVLAMSELAIASSRIPKLKFMIEQDVKGAKRALALASDPGRFLSTVQIGITLIGILAGAVSGSTLGARFSSWLFEMGLPNRFAEPIGFGVVIALITYLSLIVGELVPKQIALKNPERIACFMAPAMTVLARVSAPIVWFLERSGRVILKILGQTKASDQTLTDAEIHSMIAEAETAGVIDPKEREMIAGVMRLGDRRVNTVMTPRTDVQMIDVDMDAADIAKFLRKSSHSRFVAYRDNQDNVLGVVQSKDLAAALATGKKFTLKSLVKQAPVIGEKLDALHAITALKEAEVHIGLVYDEYGHFEGVVTSADILESIVGAFKQEDEAPSPEMVERDDGTILVAGWMPIDSALSKLGVALPEKRDYTTVAGFALDQFGRLPKVGDVFDYRRYRFEVVEMDGKRIESLLVGQTQGSHRRAG